jgi:hypothetical protein
MNREIRVEADAFATGPRKKYPGAMFAKRSLPNPTATLSQRADGNCRRLCSVMTDKPILHGLRQ